MDFADDKRRQEVIRSFTKKRTPCHNNVEYPFFVMGDFHREDRRLRIEVLHLSKYIDHVDFRKASSIVEATYKSEHSSVSAKKQLPLERLVFLIGMSIS